LPTASISAVYPDTLTYVNDFRLIILLYATDCRGRPVPIAVPVLWSTRRLAGDPA
jgi:hypothetical protein